MTNLFKDQNTLEIVKAALIKGGYGDSIDVQAAKFVEISETGEEIHEIFFNNEDEGTLDSGFVHIDKDGCASY